MYDRKAREKAAQEIMDWLHKLAPYYYIGEDYCGPVCTEATLLGLRPFVPLTVDKLEEVTIGLGAGFSAMGEVCGAVVGHVIAIGLVLASRIYDTGLLRLEIGHATRDYMRAFRDRFGAVRCEDLIGVNFMRTGAFAEYLKNKELLNRCDEFIQFGIMTLLPFEEEERSHR